jgi:hypothetical protein
MGLTIVGVMFMSDMIAIEMLVEHIIEIEISAEAGCASL